jgi:hypothetical protein
MKPRLASNLGARVACALLAACTSSAPRAGASDAAPVADATIDASSDTAPDGSPDAPPPPIDAPVADADVASGFASTEVLGRPSATAVGVSLVPKIDVDVYFEWGTSPGAYAATSPMGTHAGGAPFVASMEGLAAGTRYFYRVRWRPAGAGAFAAGAERSFQTARPRGQPFVFALQADPHLDENSSLDVYRRTLANELADAPDFLIDLGDTFMCEKHSVPLSAVVLAAPDEPTVRARYLYEHDNYATVAHSMPIFFVNGNHEGEAGWLLDGTSSNLAIWTTRARKDFFPVPYADAFFAGTAAEEPFVGQRASYYAFEWGDALFVALDPYWWSTSKSKADGWAWTLGKVQYDWLAATLQKSTAPFKYVFIHHLVGGLDGQGRGGAEAAPFYEWGGQNADGTAGFATRRPGWGKAIHQLMLDQHVTALFHGHDHLYVQQAVDGIAYQEVQQPSAVNYQSGPQLATAYHYASGVIASSSGHLRVRVGGGATKVEYVRAYLPSAETASAHNRDVVQSYTLSPR